MAPNYQIKIVTLWIVFLLGMLFHTQLGLMPLFHGLSVVESQKATSINDISTILWLMLGFFVIPMLAIIATIFTENKYYRVGHFCLTIIYSILNLAHLIADLLLPEIIWYQITLMVLLFCIGLFLNFVSYRWMKTPLRKNYPLASLKH